tara:strand:- start:22 stop:249 length:228 start_codon:yes stop_codon:yes gene_type:complete
MQNVGGEAFSYPTFRAAYETDPRIKTMVQNFNEIGVEPKTNQPVSDVPQADAAPDSNVVSNMAKRATDPGASLQT